MSLTLVCTVTILLMGVSQATVITFYFQRSGIEWSSVSTSAGITGVSYAASTETQCAAIAHIITGTTFYCYGIGMYHMETKSFIFAHTFNFYRT